MPDEIIEEDGFQGSMWVFASRKWNRPVKAISKAATIKDGQIVFLMRKAGNASYRWAAGIAQTTYGLNVGKLPIPNDGEIDLSLFYKRWLNGHLEDG